MTTADNLVKFGIGFEVAKRLGQVVKTGLTAAGTAITDALQLVGTINVLTTVAASTGAKLPSTVDVGGVVRVENRGANDLALYPPTSSGTLNAGSAGASVAIATGESATCIRLSATDWSVRISVAP